MMSDSCKDNNYLHELRVFFIKAQTIAAAINIAG